MPSYFRLDACDECCEGGCDECTGTSPEQYQVTIAGVTAQSPVITCESCATVNGTYVLTRSVARPCLWGIDTPVAFCHAANTDHQWIGMRLAFVKVGEAWWLRLIVLGYGRDPDITPDPPWTEDGLPSSDGVSAFVIVTYWRAFLAKPACESETNLNERNIILTDIEGNPIPQGCGVNDMTCDVEPVAP